MIAGWVGCRRVECVKRRVCNWVKDSLAIVGLVEAQQMRGHVGILICRMLPAAIPACRHVRIDAPEHGDVLPSLRVYSRGDPVPVVVPTDLGVLDVEVLHKVGVIVGDATMATDI